MTKPERGSRGSVQVVHRAAAILRALRDEPDGLTLSQIGERVGLSRSTVYRLVVALEHERFVVAASASRGFRLGPGLASLTMAATRDLASLLHPYLMELSTAVNETVDLSVLERDRVLFIDQIVASSHSLLVHSTVGALLDAHSTAPGKALLATLSNEEIEQLLPSRLHRHTPQTITCRAQLLDQLEAVRADGLAYTFEENAAGICAVAVTVEAEGLPLAAISVQLPAQRFEASKRTIVEAIQRTQAAVRSSLGVD